MNLFRSSRPCVPNRASAAFTFTEMMVSMAVLMLVLGGVLASHLFGARLFQLTKAKLGANQEARHAVSLLMDEIRTAKLVKIGSGTLSNFSEVALNSRQLGSTIQIYTRTNTFNYIR